jgi:acetolactate synthase-1/2/3 large subunit
MDIVPPEALTKEQFGDVYGHSRPLNVADLLIAYLEQLGIECIFGIPGGAIEPLFDAMARSARRGGLRLILARHETGAAFMADGYSRETRKIGVCCSTSGPGATNLLTGVASAYDNNIPLLVITGQPALPTFGRHPLQESGCTGVNILTMFQACTRYNSLVSHPAQLEPKLISALQMANRTPRGPVHLSFPFDVMNAPSGKCAPSYNLISLLVPPTIVDESAVQKLAELMLHSQRIVLLIGGACGESVGPILHFVAITGARFVTTPDGKGLISPYHPQYCGVFGFAGHDLAHTTLRDPQVDLIVAVGTGLGEWDSDGWSDSLLNERMVHIEESEDHLSRTPMARLHIRGRILSVFMRLVELLCDYHPLGGIAPPVPSHERPEEKIKSESDCEPILPQRLMLELGQLFPPTTRFLADAGNSVAWAIHSLFPADRRLRERRLGTSRIGNVGRRKNDAGWLRLTNNFAPMGWAIGAAIGTAVGDPKLPVVCITGDGSMLMSGQEITVAVVERLSVIFVILNDHALGMVKHAQRLRHAEQIGCELPIVDFAALARALGASAHIIRNGHDLQQLDVVALCAHRGPTLLDIRIDPEEVPPIRSRMRVLGNSVSHVGFEVSEEPTAAAAPPAVPAPAPVDPGVIATT